MKIALLKGNRLNPWHMALYRPAARLHEMTAFVPSGNLHELDGIGVRTEPIYWENEVGSFFSRKRINLKYRLMHKRTGFEIPLAPFAERLKGYDVLNTWELHTEWSAEAVRAKRRFGSRLVVVVWETIPFGGPAGPSRQAVLDAADRFVVYTERSEAALVLEGVRPDRIRRVPPGVDLAAFGVDARPDPGVRAMLPAGRPVVMFAGRLVPPKGVEYLIWAFALVLRSRSGPPPVLFLCGQSREPERYRRECERVGLKVGEDVVFLESIPYRRIEGLYRAADIFVLPSVPTRDWQEQFGMVLIEAMSCGVPVISTLSGAIPEIVGDAGVLVPPADAVALASAIESLLNDARRRAALSGEGRKRAEECFDAERNGALLLEIYKELS